MTLQPGNKTILIPLSGGGRAAIRSGTIADGDKVVMIPGENGQRYAVKPASPQIGDKVILYPIVGGGYVCLSTEIKSLEVPPLEKFYVRREEVDPPLVRLTWTRHPSHDAVRVMWRPDRFPSHPEDGSLLYEGGSTSVGYRTNPREVYYYSAWGKIGNHYSTEPLTGQVSEWPLTLLPYQIMPGYTYGLPSPSYFGPWVFEWDGTGHVYIDANDELHPRSVSFVWLTATAWTDQGEVVVTWPIYSWIYRAFEITSILTPGVNSLRLKLQNDKGRKVGCNSGAWIKQYPPIED